MKIILLRNYNWVTILALLNKCYTWEWNDRNKNPNRQFCRSSSSRPLIGQKANALRMSWMQVLELEAAFRRTFVHPITAFAKHVRYCNFLIKQKCYCYYLFSVYFYFYVSYFMFYNFFSSFLYIFGNWFESLEIMKWVKLWNYLVTWVS